MRLKPTGKIILFILALGVALGIWRFWKQLAPEAANTASTVPQKAELPQMDTSNPPVTGSNANVPLPGTGPGCADRPEVRLLGYAWNAQMGLLFAIGGPQASNGSLMCR